MHAHSYRKALWTKHEFLQGNLKLLGTPYLGQWDYLYGMPDLQLLRRRALPDDRMTRNPGRIVATFTLQPSQWIEQRWQSQLLLIEILPRNLMLVVHNQRRV